MSTDGMARIADQTAAEVCARFPVGEAARGLLRDGMTTKQFLDLLIEKEEFPDATRLLAHALPKREGVWWACLCTRMVAGKEPPEPIVVALDAAEAWVADPSEENRRAAQAAAEAAGYGTPAGCAAVAAFWSGGGLRPPHRPALPPRGYPPPPGAARPPLLPPPSSPPAKGTH